MTGNNTPQEFRKKRRRGVHHAFWRHLISQNYRPYRRILQHMTARDDIWITTQGRYMTWWKERQQSSLWITAVRGHLQVVTSHDQAVIQEYPDRFHDSATFSIPQMQYSGDVSITIDSTLKHKKTLIEILRREGILNYRVADQGDFFLARAEMDPLLARIHNSLHERFGQFQEHDIDEIRQVVIDKLSRHHLPLLRIWYHPRVKGAVPRAVFSVRHDVDRAITNLSTIRALEMKYGVESTLYLRPFGPFYNGEEIRRLASMPWCPEIALHGEFVTNANRFGDEIGAAKGERRAIEELTGRLIDGVGMHGGEGAYNRSSQTDEAMMRAGILYDTTQRPKRYYFPYRKFSRGQFGRSYNLNHAYSDVNTPANLHYGEAFYRRVTAVMEEIYQHNGVFVLMMHPVYFGLFRYLVRPSNMTLLTKFLFRHFAVNGRNGLDYGS